MTDNIILSVGFRLYIIIRKSIFKRIAMKKIFTPIIIFCLFLSLISCSQKKPIFEEDDSEINFHGNTFTVYSAGVWLSDKRQRGGSASGDRSLDRIEQIEKKYNVKIRNESDENLQTKILSLTLNGGGGCDLLSCGNDALFTFYNMNILTPFEEIGVRDHEDIKFGIPSLLVEGTFGGKQYGVTNYLGDSIPSINGFITINMNLLEELGMDDPHEYVEKGSWDWQNFRTVLQQGTFNDGEIDHVGMISDSMLGGVAAFFPATIANGGYIIKEVDGVYKTGIFDSNAIEAMEFMTGLVADGLIHIQGGTAWDIWIEGKTWPMINNSGVYSSSDITYSLVRFPYGPHGNPDIVAAYSINRGYYAFTILSGFGNDEIGIIIDDLLDPLDASLYPEGWKDYAVDNVFYSNIDYETYMTGLETMNYYPIGVLYGTNPWSNKGEVEDALYNILLGRGSIQTEIDAVRDILIDAINEQMNVGK